VVAAVIHASASTRRGRTLLAQRAAADSPVDSRRTSDYDRAVTTPLRACAMWMLLTTPSCTLGLDWTYPAVPGAARDGGPDSALNVDAPGMETGAIDTGLLDTGPGPMGGCGGQGERCCAFGLCEGCDCDGAVRARGLRA